MDAFVSLLLLQGGYNSALVMIGAALLGAGGGVIGSFSLMRRRALISDAISHATLPGVALGFLVALALTGSGRSLPILILGALTTGALGVLAVQWIKTYTRLAEDTAIGTILSVFFAVGIVLLSYLQGLDVGGRAGLQGFLLGSVATMNREESMLIAGAASLVVLVCIAFYKEFALVCFDPDFAASTGHSVARVDLLIMSLLLVLVAIGLKTVGLILIIALLIIPPATARFWTNSLSWMVGLSGVIGLVSCYVGAALSALAPDLPTGAVIVLVQGALFGISLLFAPRRGVIASIINLAADRRAWSQGRGPEAPL